MARASWDDLKTALNATARLSGKTISIQGSPDIELWVKSWNAKGNTRLDTGKTANGYKIGLYGQTPGYSINLNNSNYTGYEQGLYFPYIANDSTAVGYWLASPSAYNQSSVFRVTYSGFVVYNGNSNTDHCVRPVVSIEK